MAEQEGSKAMTIYIVACFALAMVALIGYKFTNEKRDVLATDYIASAARYADINVYSLNIGDYYYKRSQGLINAPDRSAMARTHEKLRGIAEKHRILETDNRFNVTPARAEPKKAGKERYLEYKCRAVLDNVTMTEWQAFIEDTLAETGKYAVVLSINLERKQRTFNRIEISKGTDFTQWKVTIELVWFGPEAAK
ncbi:MAG: hypothetical protein KF696_00395 [Planctomycetes bacterium]|nr:hypothetical protein [Planctomycetota bacterium]MCW8134602.1 hypothetical protein [Planctomycetota bacterium]